MRRWGEILDVFFSNFYFLKKYDDQLIIDEYWRFDFSRETKTLSLFSCFQKKDVQSPYHKEVSYQDKLMLWSLFSKVEIQNFQETFISSFGETAEEEQMEDEKLNEALSCLVECGGLDVALQLLIKADR